MIVVLKYYDRLVERVCLIVDDFMTVLVVVYGLVKCFNDLVDQSFVHSQ